MLVGREVDRDLFAAVVVFLLPTSFAFERLVIATFVGELLYYYFLLLLWVRCDELVTTFLRLVVDCYFFLTSLALDAFLEVTILLVEVVFAAVDDLPL